MKIDAAKFMPTKNAIRFQHDKLAMLIQLPDYAWEFIVGDERVKISAEEMDNISWWLHTRLTGNFNAPREDNKA